jgi:hypothetical protein
VFKIDLSVAVGSGRVRALKSFGSFGETDETGWFRGDRAASRASLELGSMQLYSILFLGEERGQCLPRVGDLFFSGVGSPKIAAALRLEEADTFGSSCCMTRPDYYWRPACTAAALVRTEQPPWTRRH